MFIQLHRAQDNEPFYMNINHIERIVKSNQNATKIISTFNKNGDVRHLVIETPEQVVSLVNEQKAYELGMMNDMIRDNLYDLAVNLN